MNHVSAAFGYPFRKGCGPAWAIGLPLLLIFPLGVLPLLGYTVAAVRSSVRDVDAGPPAWGSPLRLVGDGFWLALLIGLLTAPFAVAVLTLARLLTPGLGWIPGATDPAIAGVLGAVLAGALLGLPWGILLLVLMPAATLRFATSGRPRDLFDLARSLRCVRRDFATWNLVAVAIVTSWTVGISGLGLAGIGVVPGVFFALLASAHATAALHD